MKFRHPILVALFVPLGCLGCNSGGLSISKADLHMDTPVQRQELLTVGPSKLPVTVNQTASDGTVDIKISASGESIETERYAITDTELQLKNAGDAVFEPPVAILRLPGGAGQTWSWTGTMQEGEKIWQTKATVATSAKSLELAGVGQPCIVAVVTLSIDTGSPNPAQRVFTFWFDKAGLVQREFGMGTTRTDVDPGK